MSQLPPLYLKGKGGAIYSWRVWTEDNRIITEYGQINGKKQTAERIAEPKNTGRANATTAKEQAILEAKSMFAYNRDRKYSITVEEAQEPLTLPMLAHKYEDHKKKVSFPCHVQPKLDGFRCLARWDDNNVKLFSRANKVLNLPHITTELEKVLPPDMELDGELYLEGYILQTLSSWIKKQQPESKMIQYHVYDVPVDENGTGTHVWQVRHENRVKFFEKNKFENIFFVPTEEANSEQDILDITSDHIADGREGGMVRLLNGKYDHGHRSHDLLKVKEFTDSEFKIIGFKTGSGKFNDCCIWECETPEGKEFSVVQRGTLEQKKQMVRDAKKHVGQMLTVRYAFLTKEGKPFHPVGISVRPEWDMTPA